MSPHTTRSVIGQSACRVKDEQSHRQDLKLQDKPISVWTAFKVHTIPQSVRPWIWCFQSSRDTTGGIGIVESNRVSRSIGCEGFRTIRPGLQPSLWTYRPELDGLRALAILAVLVNHAAPGLLPGGYLGVDVFFVLSGYVVCRSWLSRERAGLSWNNFYERRIRRLLPALVTTVLVSAIVAQLFMPGWESGWRNTALSSLIGASNVQLWWSSSNYFGSNAAANPLTHTWSLGVEEQFYLVFPLLMRLPPQKRKHLWIGLALVSFAAWFLLLPHRPEAAFYLSPFRLWELALGIVLQLRESKQPLKTNRLFCGNIAGATLIYAFTLPMELQRTATTLAAVCCAALIQWGRPVGDTQVSRILVLPGLRAVGERSYGLYLWHWPLLVFAHQSWPLNAWGQQILPLICSFGLAWLSYQLLEQPLRQRTWGTSSSDVISIGATTLGVSAVAIWGMSLEGRPRDSARLAELENTLIHQTCHSPRVTDPLSRCLPPAHDHRRLILIGDSHAAHLRSAVEEALENEKSVTGTSRELIQLTDRNIPNLLLGRDGCREPSYCLTLKTLIKQIERAATPGSIVVFSLYSGRLNNEQHSSKDRDHATRVLGIHLSELAVKLSFNHAQLLLIADTPRLRCPDSLTFETAYARGGADLVDQLCSLNEREALSLRKPLHDAMQATERASKNVKLWDPHSLFCSRKRCSAATNQGDLLYWDRLGHLTHTGTNRLRKPLQIALRKTFAY